jgi:hypothetical protein
MDLTSMKLPPAEKSAEERMYPSMPPDRPEWPYGLRLRLEEDQLKALGITALPATGSTFTVTAEGFACSTSKSDDAESGVRRSLEIQITKLGLEDK